MNRGIAMRSFVAVDLCMSCDTACWYNRIYRPHYDSFFDCHLTVQADDDKLKRSIKLSQISSCLAHYYYVTMKDRGSSY